MKRITQLKDDALVALKGNFGMAALATLGIIALNLAIKWGTYMISGIDIMEYYEAVLEGDFYGMMDAMEGSYYSSLINILISIFFLAPLGVGIVNTYRLLLESKGSENSIFFNFFKLTFSKRYLHIVLVSLLSELLITLLIIPAALIMFLVGLLIQNAIAIVIFALLTVIYSIWILVMYSQVNFIILDNPKFDVIDAMRHSRTLMDGKKWKFILMILSFLGWILLCILTLGIGFLWLMPYLYTTLAAFYCDIRDAENAGQAEQE